MSLLLEAAHIRVGNHGNCLSSSWVADDYVSGAYLEVHCTYNLLSNCSYNPIVNPITTVTIDIIGL